MNNWNCPGFDGCTAPICPLDASFTSAIWCSNEPICQAKKYRRMKWRKNQVKIQRLNDGDHPKVEGCFAVERLNNIKLVKLGIKGD